MYIVNGEKLTYYCIAVRNIFNTHSNIFYAEVHFNLIDVQEGDLVFFVELWQSFEINFSSNALWN